jgi:hypothetical protein
VVAEAIRQAWGRGEIEIYNTEGSEEERGDCEEKETSLLIFGRFL